MDIPSLKTSVEVRIIDSTARIIVPYEFAENPIRGNELLDCPSFSFLIEHSSGRRILFDLGVRTDLDQLPPPIQKYLTNVDAKITVKKDVRTILEENNVDPKTIEAIIWSHWHWDHIGDPSRFDLSTALIVGPGFTETPLFVPGYPENDKSPILASDFNGRELREIDFKGAHALKIGGFDAFDFFGDGSFFILDGPGHTIGHLCALAATTMSPASYVLMGGDACHHSAEMRPSLHVPLPSIINPNPFGLEIQTPCPGAMFEHILRNGSKSLPFYAQKRPGMILCNPEIAEQTIEKIQEADGNGNIFVILAHDNHIKEVVPLFPEKVNDFLAQNWHVKTRWRFLSDFKTAVEEK